MIHPTGIGLSRRKHVPVVLVGTRNFLPHQYVALALRTLGWDVKQNGASTIVNHAGEELHLTKKKADTIVFEWRYWERCYIPPFPLHGKVVLDAGAGCGETAHLFLQHGAAKVIGVETEPEDAQLLRENGARHGWNLEVLEEPFSLRHLDTKFDLLKVDIEGDERIMLDLPRLDLPCVVEVHGEELMRAFMERFRMRISNKLRNKPVYTLDNFERFKPAAGFRGGQQSFGAP